MATSRLTLADIVGTLEVVGAGCVVVVNVARLMPSSSWLVMPFQQSKMTATKQTKTDHYYCYLTKNELRDKITNTHTKK